MSSVFTIQQGSSLLVCTAGDDVPANFISVDMQVQIANRLSEKGETHAPVNPLFALVQTKEGFRPQRCIFECLIMPVSSIVFVHPDESLREYIVNEVRKLETGIVTSSTPSIITS